MNGKAALTAVEGPVFTSGTPLYIGGLPPGMKPSEELGDYDFYQGCATQM